MDLYSIDYFIRSFININLQKIFMCDLKGGVVQQPKYKEIDTDYIPVASGKTKTTGGRGKGKRTHHSHNLEDEASLYYVIRNNRSSLTVC